MECYAISKKCNTSYLDVLEISPMERETLLRIIKDEVKKEEELANEAKKQLENNRRK